MVQNIINPIEKAYIQDVFRFLSLWASKFFIKIFFVNELAHKQVVCITNNSIKL